MKKMRMGLAQNPDLKLKIPVELFEPEEIEGLLLDLGFKETQTHIEERAE